MVRWSLTRSEGGLTVLGVWGVYFLTLFDFCFNLSYLLSLFLDCFRLFVYWGSILSPTEFLLCWFWAPCDSYIEINMDKCENKNSQMECSAIANGETSSNPNTRKLAVSWCCSTALSQFPSQNYFKTEKNLQAENFIFYYQRTIVPKRGGFKNRQVGKFHEVIWLPSVTFHLKIILRWKKFYKPKISYFITKENRATAGTMWFG